MREIEALFEYLKPLGVDSHQLSPAYGYSAVDDREIFMTRDDIHREVPGHRAVGKRFPVNHTPVYLEFLTGGRDLPCTAWGTPTYNVKGWKGPCYLITDAHYKTFEELMTRTPWESYGAGNDPAVSIAWRTAGSSRRRRWELTRSCRTDSSYCHGCCARGPGAGAGGRGGEGS